MHIVSCEHPKVIYNRYLGRTLRVRCGKCNTCRNARNTSWVNRLNDERRCWRYCFELYLDYNDDYLPSFDFGSDGDYLSERQSRFYYPGHKFEDVNIPLSDLQFKDDHERNYVFERLNSHYTALPHPSVRDIQLFKKRLNKYCYELTGKYKTFRSAICSEIGPTTFRPHYHGIIFFNDSRLSDKICSLVDRAWQDGFGHSLGHAYAVPDRGGITSYVAQYIVKSTDLPLLYSLPAFRPFFLTSRRPPIGSLFESESEVRQIFDECSCQRVVAKVTKNKVTPQVVSISESLENRLFPRCPLFSSLSPTLRTELYKSAISSTGLVSDFNDYLGLIVMRICKPEYLFTLGDGFITDNSQCRPSQFADLITIVTHNFENESALKPLHNMICRIWFQSEIFNVSFDEYLRHIYDYYDNKDLYNLKCQYEFQADYVSDKRHHADDLLCMYPFQTPENAYMNIREYQSMVVDSKYIHDCNSKTVKKNAYFEKLKLRDSSLYKLIKSYHYGKKHYEALEAIS